MVVVAVVWCECGVRVQCVCGVREQYVSGVSVYCVWQCVLACLGVRSPLPRAH